MTTPTSPEEPKLLTTNHKRVPSRELNPIYEDPDDAVTSPEPETSGQDAVSDEAVEAAVADLRRVATECVCGTDDGDTGICTCPSIFEHAVSGYEVVEIHGLVEDIARWVLTAGAPHIRADALREHVALLRAEAARVIAEARGPRRNGKAAAAEQANRLLYAADYLDGWYRVTTADRKARGLPTGGTRQEAPVEGPSAAVDARVGTGAVVGTGGAPEANQGAQG